MLGKQAELVDLNQFKSSYFLKFQDLFVKEYGLFYGENRIEQFRSILLRFIKETSCESFDDFLSYLSINPSGKALFKEIVDEITIGETYFFRNEPQLDVFKDHVIPELIKMKRSSGTNTIKVWCAGCSTGEEPYSLGMLLLENLPTAKYWDIKILGTDINRKVLDYCERGSYYGSRFEKHLPPLLLKKYFVEEGGRFSVHPDLKNIVSFSRHNLINDSFNLPEMVDVDVIFCRNVTIYFNAETTKKLVSRFYNALRDHGYFFIGHSETLWKINDQFKTIDFPRAFIYQKPSPGEIQKSKKNAQAMIPDMDLKKLHDIKDARPSSPLPSSLLSTSSEDYSQKSREELEELLMLDVLYNQGVMAFESSNYEKAIQCFDQILEKDNKYLIANFAKATILSNQAKYQDAIKEIEKAIQIDSLFTEAYFLKGILHIKLEEPLKATTTLKQVIYIDPEHCLAYLHLGNLYRDQGDMANAQLAFKNIQRICQSFPDDATVPFAENYTYGSLFQVSEKSLLNLQSLS